MRKFHIINEQTYSQRGTTLWRYFDLHKFYSFLNEKQIRFTRMDSFEDPLEGISLNDLAVYYDEMDYNKLDDENLAQLILKKELNPKLSSDLRVSLQRIKQIQKYTFVSCWFISKRESMAMWNLYSNSDGVAIRVSAPKLFEFFKNYDDPSLFSKALSFYGGKVKYQNFNTIDPDSEDAEVPKDTLRKDLSFEHENEFRFVIRIRKENEEIDSISIPMQNLNEIGLRIYCHPLMPQWKKNNIKAMLQYAGLSKSYTSSEITLRR